MLLRKKVEGYVNILGGKVDITDPCYDYCSGYRINNVSVKPGDYRCVYHMGAALEEAEIEKTEKLAKEYGANPEEWVRREQDDIKNRCFVIEIQFKGRAFDLDSSKWKEIGSISVDAGLAGFFWNKPDFTDEEWNDFCEQLENSSKNVYLDKNMGFWCLSGYGDGMYKVFAIKDKNEVIALKNLFLMEAMNMENEEVKYYQPRFRKWIKSDKWDSIAECLSETHMSIITKVMNAKKDGDCSWIIWHQCDNVLESIKRVAKRID